MSERDDTTPGPQDASPNAGARAGAQTYAGRWRGLDIAAEGTGISKPLSEQVNLLGTLLGQAVRKQAGNEMLETVEHLRRLCKQAALGERPEGRREAADAIRGLDIDRIRWLLRAYTAFFHLVNQAERQEIIRINRERARSSSPDHPRAESIEEAVHALHAEGLSFDEVVALLGRIDIQPTLTAHPTEARRRSILFKQQHISALLARLGSPDRTPEDDAQVFDEIHNQIALLLATDEVRTTRPSVEDEVEQGLYFMRNAIWETIPEIYRDLRRALRVYYGRTDDLPVVLRYRSWIGSDRDGNPNVTADVTRRTIRLQRYAALEMFTTELRTLRRELSISDRQAPIPQALRDDLEAEQEAWPLDEAPLRAYRHEPYRLKISYMMSRVDHLMRELRDETGDRHATSVYTGARFVEDLRLLKTCLAESGFEDLADAGQLGRVLVLAQTFGFHMAALDIRQHSRVHEEAVAALLRLSGVHDGYAALGEDEKLALLAAELSNPRPLLPRGTVLPDEARRVMETFDVIAEALAAEPSIVGSYVISMTHTVSDMLEVLLLAKEAGLWRLHDGEVASRLDVVPLFETIEDLRDAEALLDAIFTNDVYRRHLAARDGFQEIMLGYSDSNKDGGYWMANWALHQAQDRIARACRRHEVDFRLFHGRGGTVGRGGGGANQAILAMPHAVHNGRIRFTEQGEVISFRYALPGIARRHLEQIVNAMVRSTALGRADAGGAPDAAGEADRALMERIATESMQAYRALIEADGLWSWYTRATPIEQISRLPIASRPVSRRSARTVDFDDLRAIPWVFAWTQTRYNVPGWYGIGRGLQAAVDADAANLDALRRLYRAWPFFRAVLRNAQREMARARFEVARHYARLADEGENPPPDFHAVLHDDFERARDVLLRITGNEVLMGDNPVIRKSITLRNPYTDVLNLLQIELIRRFRQTPEEREDEREELRQALFLSINGIAAAMQSTG